MSGIALVRLLVAAATVAAAQATVIDPSEVAAFRHLNLPLAVAVSLALLRPGDAAVIGFSFGLAVDVFQQRLFGLHALGFIALAPVAANLPIGALRTRSEVVACLAAVQSIAATTVVAAGGWLLAGVRPSGLFGRLIEASAWSVGLALCTAVMAGGRLGAIVHNGSDPLEASTGSASGYPARPATRGSANSAPLVRGR